MMTEPKVAIIFWTGREWVAWEAADPDCETIAAAMPQEHEPGADDALAQIWADPMFALTSLLDDLEADGYTVDDENVKLESLRVGRSS